MRRVVFTATVSAVLLATMSLGQAAPTPAQKCAATKNKLAGTYAACLQKAVAAFVLSANGDRYATAREGCRKTFRAGWAKADAKAAKAGTTCGDALSLAAFEALIDDQRARIESALAGCGNGAREEPEECDGDDLAGATCTTRGFAVGTLRCSPECAFDYSGCFASRFVDNGDQTVTDNLTGLQWEKKASDCVFCEVNEHTVSNKYVWTVVPDCLYIGCPTGDAFHDFLGRLNPCWTFDPAGVPSHGFAGHCDWRLPTVQELLTIRDPDACAMGGNPCIDPIFGPTAADIYWSSSTLSSSSVYAEPRYYAWAVSFHPSSVAGPVEKYVRFRVRAVRDTRP